MDEMVELKPSKFNVIKEEWNRYKLEDGSIMEVKLILLKVLEHEGEKDEVGYPVYTIQSHNVINILKE